MFDSFSRVDVQPVGCSSGKKNPELNIFELYLEFRRSVKRSAPLCCNSLCGAAGPLRKVFSVLEFEKIKTTGC